MSIEALWLVEFRDTNNAMHSGSGVIVFETGRVFGGDSSIVYLGSYEVVHNILTLKVKLIQHTKVDGMSHMFGDGKEYEATVTGKYNDTDQILELSGTAEGSDIEIIVTATHLAELP
jgi:hypothetical protein